jgi:hypothetical protein
MYFAKYKNEAIAVNFLVFDDNSIYLMEGINPDKKDISGIDLIQFESETVPKCQDQYILKFNILHNLSNFFAIFISFSV